MRPQVACLILLLFANIHAIAQLKGDSYAEAKKKGAANVILSYIETPAYTYKDGQNKLVGIPVELMEAFFQWVEQKEGIKVSYKVDSKNDHDFNKMLLDVKTGQDGVFGIGNIAITEERKKDFIFSPNYLTTFTLFVTHKDAPTLGSIKTIGTDFSGMKAYVAKGTIWEKNMEEIKASYYPTLKIEYASYNGLIDKVVADPKSFTNVSFNYFAVAVKNGQPVKRHQAADSEPIDVGMIMPKNNDWAPLLTEFINSGYLDSPQFRKTLHTHLGTNGVKLYDALADKKKKG